MTARTPLVLLALAILLGGYIALFERGQPKQSDVEARDGFLLAPLARERVTAVEIQPAAGETIRMRREGEGFDETWTFERPDSAPVDLEKIEDYLRNWEFAIPTRTLEAPSTEDLRNFGLVEPKATVRFEMGRASVQVGLGSGSPVDGGGYVRVDEHDHAVVVPDSVVALFDFDPEAFVVPEGSEEPTLDDLDVSTPNGVAGGSATEPSPTSD
ncbi:MAG: DUF4340 domain-containing protein [Myxococcota bacterium]